MIGKDEIKQRGRFDYLLSLCVLLLGGGYHGRDEAHLYVVVVLQQVYHDTADDARDQSREDARHSEHAANQVVVHDGKNAVRVDQVPSVLGRPAIALAIDGHLRFERNKATTGSVSLIRLFETMSGGGGNKRKSSRLSRFTCA